MKIVFDWMKISNGYNRLLHNVYQYTGKKYVEVCAIAKMIAEELRKAGAKDYDLLAVDYQRLILTK